jgi:hypothetical protein
MNLRFTAIAFLASAALGCPPSGVTSVSTGSHDGEDSVHGEQAEVSITAGHAFVFPILAAGFNDFSVDSHFSYSPSLDDPQTRTLTRGVSLMGWSTSVDLGNTWTYQGKIQPPKGWSALWGDPTITTDPAQSNVIYYSVLGISDAAWNAVYGNVDTITGSPGADAADSFCVARSQDTGMTFPDITCVAWAKRPQQADRTALAVDGQGRVWVASNITDGLSAFSSVVFHSNESWNDFTQAPAPPRPGQGEPWLVRDSNGEIWFNARESAGVGTQHWNDAQGNWDQSFDVAGQCGLTLAPRDPVIGVQGLRNAHSYSIWFGLNEAGNFVVRAALTLLRDDQRQYLQVIEIDQNNSGVCIAPDNWSTAGKGGQQFEPSFSYENRDGLPWWQLVYLSTEGVPDPTQPYVHPVGVRPLALPLNNGPLYLFTFETNLAPLNWFACTRTDDYWGDYFGVTQVKDTNMIWSSVAGFSDSTPAPKCQAQTSYLSRPLHVSSSRW